MKSKIQLPLGVREQSGRRGAGQVSYYSHSHPAFRRQMF